MKVKFIITVLAMIGLSSISFGQGHQFNITKDTPFFANGAANQVAYIDFGDIKFWGYMEITVTGGWSNQNNIGQYTKRYEIGKNVGHLYRATSEVPTSFGLVSNQWKLGEAFIDANKHLKIPIYHLVSTGNLLTVNINGLSVSNFDKNLITITTPITLANTETRDYVTYKSQVHISDKVGIGTTSPKESLDVNGSVVIKNGHNLSWGDKYGAGIPTIAANTASGLHFYPNGSTLGATMKISKDGKTQFMNNIAVSGKIESKEIKVTNTPTADFVFEENYNLPSLKEIEQHIKEKKHLPEIASAKEMKKNGVNIGNFQIQLLQKIEELTLYTITQEKQLKVQEEKIKTLEKQTKEIEELKTLVKKLLKD